METSRSQRWRDQCFRLVDDVELVDPRAYCFELTREARRRGRALPRQPYPKLLPGPDPQFSFAFA